MNKHGFKFVGVPMQDCSLCSETIKEMRKTFPDVVPVKKFIGVKKG